MLRLVFAAWACATYVAVGLVYSRQEPTGAAKDFVEKEMAINYMKTWEDKQWEKEEKSCDLTKLPKTTDAVVLNSCGNGEEGKRCVCNLAKAHSCHVGCRKMKAHCPAGCHEGKCFAGDPSNGGQDLSGGGHSGNCHAACTAPIGGYRYCGSGDGYKLGLYLDCTGCKPLNLEAMSEKEKHGIWTKCMADCFPTPSCATMCGEGTPACFDGCVHQYMDAVEPYWEMFKGSLQYIPLLPNSTDKKEELAKKGEEPAKEGAKKEEEPAKEGAKEADHAEVEEDEDDWEDEEDDDWEDEEDDDWEDEEDDDWEDEEEEEGDYEDEEEGEWKDPWAGEHEWDEDDEYYDFHLRSVNSSMPGMNSTEKGGMLHLHRLHASGTNGTLRRRHRRVRRRRFHGTNSTGKDRTGLRGANRSGHIRHHAHGKHNGTGHSHFRKRRRRRRKRHHYSEKMKTLLKKARDLGLAG